MLPLESEDEDAVLLEELVDELEDSDELDEVDAEDADELELDESEEVLELESVDEELDDEEAGEIELLDELDGGKGQPGLSPSLQPMLFIRML